MIAPTDPFRARNRWLRGWVERCDSFKKLVLAMSVHLAGYARQQHIPVREMRFDGIVVTDIPGVLFTPTYKGQRITNQGLDLKFEHTRDRAMESRVPDEEAYFDRTNRGACLLASESDAFDKLVRRVAGLSEAFCRTEDLHPRQVQHTTPRFLHDGSVYFEIYDQFLRVASKLDSINHVYVDC